MLLAKSVNADPLIATYQTFPNIHASVPAAKARRS